jgi:hypothetical protein
MGRFRVLLYQGRRDDIGEKDLPDHLHVGVERGGIVEVDASFDTRDDDDSSGGRSGSTEEDDKLGGVKDYSADAVEGDDADELGGGGSARASTVGRERPVRSRRPT